MINELIFMNGYGLYVWSAFGFTLIKFYIVICCDKNSITLKKKINSNLNLGL